MIQFLTARGPVELRELGTLADMRAAEDIQARVWGAGVHPKELLIPVQHEGGFLGGAFTASGELISLVFSFPTHEPTAAHSQLLATVDEWRGLGIGTRLKWYQREWCLSKGINHLRWTVDPLRAANAEVNIRHLGGITSTYYPDYYGEMQGIDAGVPSDRLLIEWDLLSRRVAARENAVPADPGFPKSAAANLLTNGLPRLAFPLPQTGEVLIHIPDDFIHLAKENLPLALRWREQTRQLCLHYFSAGYTITNFTRMNGPAYLLEKNGGGK